MNYYTEFEEEKLKSEIENIIKNNIKIIFDLTNKKYVEFKSIFIELNDFTPIYLKYLETIDDYKNFVIEYSKTIYLEQSIFCYKKKKKKLTIWIYKNSNYYYLIKSVTEIMKNTILIIKSPNIYYLIVNYKDFNINNATLGQENIISILEAVEKYFSKKTAFIDLNSSSIIKLEPAFKGITKFYYNSQDKIPKNDIKEDIIKELEENGYQFIIPRHELSRTSNLLTKFLPYKFENLRALFFITNVEKIYYNWLKINNFIVDDCVLIHGFLTTFSDEKLEFLSSFLENHDNIFIEFDEENIETFNNSEEIKQKLSYSFKGTIEEFEHKLKQTPYDIIKGLELFFNCIISHEKDIKTEYYKIMKNYSIYDLGIFLYFMSNEKKEFKTIRFF